MRTDDRRGKELVRQKGLEPLAHCLEGSCSIQLSYWREWMEQVTRIELASPAWKAGALTIVLHLRLPSVETVSLDMIAYPPRLVKGFSGTFSRHRQRSAKAASSASPSGPRRRSGCHCTAHTGLVRCSRASTTPSGAHWAARSRSPSRSAA